MNLFNWFKKKPVKEQDDVEIVIAERLLKIRKPRAKARLERLLATQEKHGDNMPEDMVVEIKVLNLHLRNKE